jgi:hypothetical protein
MGKGKKEKLKKIGKVKGISKDKDGRNQSNIFVSIVMLSPNVKYNLISITKEMKNGWKLEGDSDHIKFKKGDKEFAFSIEVNTLRGVLCAVRDANVKQILTETKDQENLSQTTKMLTSIKLISILDTNLKR